MNLIYKRNCDKYLYFPGFTVKWIIKVAQSGFARTQNIVNIFVKYHNCGGSNVPTHNTNYTAILNKYELWSLLLDNKYLGNKKPNLSGIIG